MGFPVYSVACSGEAYSAVSCRARSPRRLSGPSGQYAAGTGELPSLCRFLVFNRCTPLLRLPPATARSATARIRLWAKANHNTTALTVRRPRTRNRCRPPDRPPIPASTAATVLRPGPTLLPASVGDGTRRPPHRRGRDPLLRSENVNLSVRMRKSTPVSIKNLAPRSKHSHF